MKKPKIRFSFNTWWQYAFTTIVIAGALALLLVSQLETLLPGYSNAEINASKYISSYGALVSSPVNLPYNTLAYAINMFIDAPLLSMRITSVIFGVLFLALFYVGTRHWYAPRTAFLTTTLLACSSWFLHTSRLGTPDILLPFTLMSLAISSYWIASAHRHALGYFAALVATGLAVFTPAAIWIVAIGILFRKKDFLLLKRRLPVKYRLGLYAFALIFIVIPLVVIAGKNPHTIPGLLGLPADLPNITQYIKNLIAVPLSIFVWSPTNPLLTLGNLSLLDSFASIVAFLGTYYYVKFRTLIRVKLLGLTALALWLLIALNGPVSISSLLPLIYIVVAAGIGLLLSQWLVVFPRNPLAKSVGIFLVTVVVSLSCIYNLRLYFVAWPNNTDVRKEFSHTSQNLIQ